MKQKISITDESPFIIVPDSFSAIAKMVGESWYDATEDDRNCMVALGQLCPINKAKLSDQEKITIRSFLDRAVNWRGEMAKAVKDRLKEILKANKRTS